MRKVSVEFPEISEIKTRGIRIDKHEYAFVSDKYNMILLKENNYGYAVYYHDVTPHTNLFLAFVPGHSYPKSVDDAYNVAVMLSETKVIGSNISFSRLTDQRELLDIKRSQINIFGKQLKLLSTTSGFSNQKYLLLVSLCSKSPITQLHIHIAESAPEYVYTVLMTDSQQHINSLNCIQYDDSIFRPSATGLHL